MTVFLTGGSGFLGSHVAEVLKEQGHDIIAMVRPSSPRDHLQGLGVRLHEGTLEDVESIVPALEESDAVVHVAGLVKAIRPADFRRVNEEGTRQLAVAADRHARGNRFILVSSIAAQGPGDGPWERKEGVTEAPVTEYGRSKLAGEKALMDARGDLSVTILRPPIIYGPREIEFLEVFKAARRVGIVFCLEPKQTLSLVHGRDCARAIVAAVEREVTPEDTYLMDDGGLHTWSDVAAVIADVMGKRVRMVAVPRLGFKALAWAWQTWSRITGTAAIMTLDKVHEAEERFWVAGNSRISRDLGYEPEYDFRKGVEDTLAWARGQGVL